MARSFLSFAFALASATLVLLAGGARQAAAQPASRQQEPPELQEAKDLLDGPTHDLPGAMKLLETAARKDHRLPSANVLMYGFLMRRNRPDLAIRQLDEAVRSNPSDPEPYVILGSIAWQDRRLVDATLNFDKAQQLLAAYTNAQRKALLELQLASGMAFVAEAREDWKEVESRLRALLKVEPENGTLYQRLARALFRQGQYQKAYDVLNEGKQHAKKDKDRESFLTPEAILGQYFDQSDIRDAKKYAEGWFKKALEVAPNDLPTCQVVATWALENGKVAFAKEQAEAILKIEASNPKYSGSSVGRELRGLVALWEKDFPAAENYFKTIILEDPNNYIAKNNMALALVEQKDLAKKRSAVLYAEANYHDYPKNPEVLSTLGWVNINRDPPDWDAARNAIEASREVVRASGGKFADHLDLYTYLAHVLHHDDRDPQAKALLQEILKNDRPFGMRPEAEKLYDVVKSAKSLETPQPAKTP